MTNYLEPVELASFLDQDQTSALEWIVEMTNTLIDDEWENPVDPVPARVKNLAWTVAIRAGVNPKGLSSWTRSWDDISRTERMESGRAAGVYLTDDERDLLNGYTPTVRKAKSIRLGIPGWTA